MELDVVKAVEGQGSAGVVEELSTIFSDVSVDPFTAYWSNYPGHG